MILRAALGALFISVLAIGGARAADLGGNCCADLEERIAELEATAAKSGNRKMHIVIYGQVDKAWLYESNSFSITTPPPRGSPRGTPPTVTNTKDQTGVIDNANAPTMFGIAGESKLNANLKAGFKIEIQLDASFANQFPVGPDKQNVPTIRTAVGWFDTAVGKFTIGHGSMASDMTGQVSTANTVVASRMLSLAPVSTVFLGGFDLPYNDIRRDSLRYDSPSFFGLMVSGSVANGDGTPCVAPCMFVTTHDAWDIAARYANEFKGAGGWRVAGAISYRDETQSLFIGPTGIGDTRSSVTQGSGSVMHLATGLFLNVAGGHIENDLIFGNANNYQLQGGVEKNFFGFGASTAFVEYAWMDITPKIGTSVSPKMWGLGAVQSFDALAVDLYADYKHYDTDKVFVPTITGDVFMAGMRVKF